jgi:glyoxylase-like metal-dependent hydrolase (beta-lactamase superfamily II)
VIQIHTIDLHDLGAPESIAAYLLLGPEGPVLVEVGPSATFDALIAGLDAHGVRPADVRHALVTHIHFDHAGAVGHLAGHGATIHVHEFGAKHLIDPERLVSSARRLYPTLERRWGPILPVPAARVRPVHDGDVVEVGGIALRAIETPGHARHHHAFAVETDDGPVCFTGDAAATRLPDCAFISLPTPPPEFDLERWLATLDRLEAGRFTRIYPTHFGAVDDPARHLGDVRRELVAHTALVRTLFRRGLDDDAILDVYRGFVEAQAERLQVPDEKRRFYVSDAVPEMNIIGMLRYFRASELAATS